jgi:hypothetical protein
MDNMKLIEAKTVTGSSTAIVEFTSIPQTYTDLYITTSGRTNESFDDNWVKMTFNNTGGTSNNSVTIRGNGTNVAFGTRLTSDFMHGVDVPAATATANFFNNASVYIPNYTSAYNKSASLDSATQTDGTYCYLALTGTLLTNTAAISSVKFETFTGGSVFVANTTFYLYGISNTIASGAKATGGYVTEDASYFYHTFLSSGVFTPTQSLTCDFLVIAGGGGGSNGGGGAGGLRSSVGTTGGGGILESPLSVTATSYAITVGAGGAGQNAGSLAGTNGNNSIFSTVTSTAGGGGGAQVNSSEQNGKNGGSGGGTGFGRPGPSGTVGTGTANQGFDGGQSYSDQTTYTAGGGGGGAGAVGASVNSANGNGANGGAGVAISALAIPTFTGRNNAYAGGGAGASAAAQGKQQGIGGLGGGGNGAEAATNPGASNTGSGGGGRNDSSSAAGSGGSGLVVIRYAK